MKLRTMLFYSRALFGLNGGEPDFLIIGAQKSGTTSLFRYIIQSPHFVRSAGKELHYFDHRYDSPVSQYRRQFPKLDKSGRRFTGEASPSYLFYDFVPERVAAHLPDVKIIATLRNPVDRALSQFNHNRRRGRFLHAEGRTLTTFDDHIRHNLTMNMTAETPRETMRHFHIVERGFYQSQIENWLRHFRREQMHFINFEALSATPQTEIDRLMAFLGKPRYRLKTAEPFNSGGGYSRKLSNDVQATLTDLYRWKNAGLSELVGFDTDNWFEERR